MSDEPKKPDLTIVKGGVEGVAQMIDDAEPVAPQQAGDSQAAGNVKAAEPKSENDQPFGSKPKDKLPKEFPVQPLGLNGDFFFYLDANGQYRVLKHSEHSRLQMASLLGSRISAARYWYPVFNKDGEWQPSKWDHSALALDLMQACAKAGIWRALDRVRGPGAWTDEEGALIFHCGNTLQTAAGKKPLGMIGKNVYPADEPQPAPAKATSESDQAEAAERLEKVLRTWAWKRPDVDPALLLGWIGAAILGGALPWRPTIWTTGGAGTGKSTLNELLALIFDGGLVAAADTSAAGIWTALGFRSLPVVLDELEPEADDRKQQAIIKFARLASSGGLVLRGSADHKGAEFKARSCFSFSSINVPALTPQDLSRMAILELDTLPKDTPALSLRPGEWRAVGGHLRARLLANWPKFKETLNLYRSALAELGHSARGCDQFGTLLACADLLTVTGDRHSDEIELIVAPLTPATLNETVENLSESERCLNIIRTAVPDTHRQGYRKSVAELIHEYWELRSTKDIAIAEKVAEINKPLGTLGLRVMRLPECSQLVLMVANDHKGLAEVFAGTHWADGVWRQSLLRARAFAFAENFESFTLPRPQRIAGSPHRGVFVPLPIFVGEAEEPAALFPTPAGGRDNQADGTVSEAFELE